jgi:hypothetical protein
MRFKRPIYRVLTFYGIGLLCFLVMARAHLAERKEVGEAVTTIIAVWFLGAVAVIAAIKLIRDLMNPKRRKFLFDRTDCPPEDPMQDH